MGLQEEEEFAAMEDDDKAIVGQLGGFALEHFLGSFTGEQGISGSSLSAVGLNASSSSSSRAVDVSQIYNGRFVDEDEEDDGGVEGEDWEDEVDREMNEEHDNMQSNQQQHQLMLPQLPVASTSFATTSSQTLMRGEDEDFDDDDEDEQGGESKQGLTSSTVNGSMSSNIPSAFHLPDASEIMHVKQEEQEMDGVMYGHPTGHQQEHRPLLDIHDTRDHQEREDDEDQVDAEELAAQQALFAQSYARMQAQQNIGTQEGYNAADTGHHAPLMDVKTLYPSFAPDKILNFTEIFHPRPRKRVRIDPNIEVCK